MILVLVLVGMAVFGVRQWRQWRWQQASERLAGQFRASLQNMVFALRAGVSFPEALEYAAREGEEPMAGHWRNVCQALQLGRDLRLALDELAAVLDLREARLFAAAVDVTHSTGGSLAMVLETLAGVLEQRQNLREKVSALTAQGKASGVLLAALPFVVLGAVSLMAPELASPLLTTPAGQGLITIIMVMVAAGAWTIRRIVSVEL